VKLPSGTVCHKPKAGSKPAPDTMLTSSPEHGSLETVHNSTQILVGLLSNHSLCGEGESPGGRLVAEPEEDAKAWTMT
jgi:hypothetical protein